MKTLKNLFKLVIFVLMITVISPVNAQDIQIGQAFSSDTTFNPFNGEHDVYSFKMTGGITLLSDSSLVRVVLTDHAGNHRLLYEAYPLIDTLNSFSVQDVCDETCFLDKITPDSIRVDIINAIVSIEKFTYDLNEIQNVHDLQVQQKWVNDSVKISILNQIIQQDTMFWRAGRNNLTQLSFSEKEQLFKRNFNLEGYDYYRGGIYRRFSDHQYTPAASTITEAFDWRARHGANIPPTNEKPSPYYDGDPSGSGWITKCTPFSQGGCQACYAFSAVAAIEAYVNLYFNNNTGNTNPQVKHHIDVDLSEGEAIRCEPAPPTTPNDCCDYGFATDVFYFAKTDGINNENCYPWSYISQNCSVPSPVCTTFTVPTETIKIYNYMDYGGTILGNEDIIKRNLIKFGPLVAGINNYPTPGPNPHDMLLVGYFLPDYGDTVYKGNDNDPPIILQDDVPWYVTGSTVWVFKDSYTDSFIYLQKTINDFTNYDEDILYDQIDRTHNPPLTTKIKCWDEDGDGYYWWGIHWYRDNGDWTQVDPKLCECPPGVNVKEEDCDDNNVSSGPYDQDDPQNNNYLGTYNCIQNNCIKSSTPIEINGQASVITWDTDRHINQDVIIEPSYTLSVTAEIFFAPGTRILVRPGGTLVVAGRIQNSKQYNARLTSACGQFWGGVVLDGSPTQSQTVQNQGVISINYGTIENAFCGIKTSTSTLEDSPGAPNPGDGHATGGIIYADNALFHNNVISVELFPYRNGTTPNISHFYHCNFLTDDGFFTTDDPYCFLKIDGVNIFNIRDCGFKNYMTFNSSDPKTHYSHRGIGIFSFDSQIDIEAVNSLKCTFERLDRGIYAINGGLGQVDFKLHDAIFSDNAYGAYLSAYSEVNLVDIRQNSFSFQNNFGGTVVYGLYLDHCSSFTVTKNYFIAYSYNPSGSKPNIYGIIVNNSGAKTNYIYNNYDYTDPNDPKSGFKSLYTGVQGQNVNRGFYTPDNGFPYPWPIETGLRFICNDFENCINDIADLRDDALPDWSGITHFQRNSESTTGTQQPAGNTFSTSHYNQPSGQYDIEIDPNPKVKDILYKFHILPIYSQTLRLKPTVVNNPDQVNYEETNFTYSKSESCPDLPPSNISKEGLKSAISQSDNKIDSLLSLLHSLTDDGSTDTLKNMVESSSPNQSYNVYQDLLNASPFLSDTVLKTSIIKEEVLQNPMIRDIMVANPQSAKNGDLLNALDNRYDPMPDSMWSDILEGRDTVGAMEQLQSELSGWIQLRDEYFNGLIRYFMNDTIDENPSDSLIGLLHNDFSLISRYNLITFYLEHHNFTQAGNTLQEISNDFSLSSKDQQICQNFSDLISVVEQMVNDTLGYNIPDSSQTLILQGLITDDYNLPAAFARNILIATGLLNYQEPVLLESSQKSSRNYHHYGNKAKQISDFQVYPNPCKDYVIVSYKKENPSDLAVCSVLNSRGIKLATYELRKSTDQIVIPFQSFPSGTYFIRLQVNGINKGSYQIVKIY